MRLGNGQHAAATVNFFWSSSPDYTLSRDFEDVWRPELRRFALIRLHAMVERAAGRFPVDPTLPRQGNRVGRLVSALASGIRQR